MERPKKRIPDATAILAQNKRNVREEKRQGYTPAELRGGTRRVRVTET